MKPLTDIPDAPVHETDRAGFMVLLQKDYVARIDGKRHWLDYHFQSPSVFGLQLLTALAECEMGSPGLGFLLLADLAATPYAKGEPGKAGFQQLLQKLAEVVALRVLVTFEWPEGTTIRHEPAHPVNGKRPELAVDTPERLYLFEVKCPSLIDHQWARYRNPRQVPSRSAVSDLIRAENLGAPKDAVTWPRDNVLKDFLASAQEKFSGFNPDKPTHGALIVVWDHHMYEAVSPLINDQSGLLTEASFLKDAQGTRVPFSAVDTVIVLNHLTVLSGGAQETGTLHRADPFAIDAGAGSPNVWFRNIGGQALDEALLRAFDAVNGVDLASFAADYAPQEMIMWLDMAKTRGQVAARRWKRSLFGETCPAALGG